MGMFDYVNYEMDCPTCGEKLDSFQSKDGRCVLETIEYWEVDNFYDYCDTCKVMVEFNRIRTAKEPVPITDYKMSTR